MCEEKKAIYKFNNNLLKLSEEKTDIKQALKEWKCLNTDLQSVNPQICICQHNIKKEINTFINLKNNNTIFIGSKCYEKFEFKFERTGSDRVGKILQKHIQDYLKGEYTIISNFKDYVEKVFYIILNDFKIQYKNYKHSINGLKQLLHIINLTIEEYQFLKLKLNIEPLVIKIKNKIEKLKIIEEEQKKQIENEKRRLQKQEEKKAKEQKRLEEEKEKLQKEEQQKRIEEQQKRIEEVEQQRLNEEKMNRKRKMEANLKNIDKVYKKVVKQIKWVCCKCKKYNGCGIYDSEKMYCKKCYVLNPLVHIY